MQYILRNQSELFLPQKNKIVIRPVDVSIATFRAGSISCSKRSRTIFSPLRFPLAPVILNIFLSGGMKLISAVISEVGCLSSSRNTLYCRASS